jgi:uncharacterized membrane protein YphA (DoxX/SURF4 family)
MSKNPETPNRHRDMGLLLLRMGIGMMMLLEGVQIIRDDRLWIELDAMMDLFNWGGNPVLWGMLIGSMATCGGVAFAVGLLHRLSTFVLLVIATVMAAGSVFLELPWASFAAATQMWLVFASFLFIGAGDYSLDRMLARSRGAGNDASKA